MDSFESIDCIITFEDVMHVYSLNSIGILVFMDMDTTNGKRSDSDIDSSDDVLLIALPDDYKHNSDHMDEDDNSNSDSSLEQISDGDMDEERFDVDSDDMEESMADNCSDIDINSCGDDEDIDGSVNAKPKEDMSMQTLRGHGTSVFGCAFHPSEILAATGSEDDSAIVWDLINNKKIQCIKHNDTVTHLGFNHDGQYLMSADMSGKIIVSKVTKSASPATAEGNANGNGNDNDNGTSTSTGADNGGGDTSANMDDADDSGQPRFQIVEVNTYQMDDMLWAFWHKHSNVVFAGGESGSVYVWRISDSACKVLPPVASRCESGDISADGKKLICGYSAGKVCVWNIKESKKVYDVIVDSKMQATIRWVKAHRFLEIYAALCDDKVTILSEKGKVNEINVVDDAETMQLSPSTDYHSLAVGSLAGRVQIYDPHTLSLRHDIRKDVPQLHQGIACMLWLNEFLICCGQINGDIFIFDARDGTEKVCLTGHIGSIYDMFFNKQRGLLLTACEDGVAKIFDLTGLTGLP